MQHPSVSDGYDSQKQTSISDEFRQTGNLHFKSLQQKELEIQRYKQDCRKRAFDLAHSEHSDWVRTRSENVGIPEPNIPELANTYYKWLTDIPDTK